MSFQLFGFDVDVQPGFLITIGLLGFFGSGGDIPAVLVFILVAFVSILVHELGHAFAIRRHGIQPDIALHWMGGTTSWRPIAPLSRGQRIIISLAGPGAGFFLALLVYLALLGVGDAAQSLPRIIQYALNVLIFINVIWGVINLLPVLPFDGGHVLEQALGPKRARTTLAISTAVGGLVALLFALNGYIFAAFVFGMGAFQSFQRYKAESPDPAPLRAEPEPEGERISPAVSAKLRRARNALAEDEIATAMELAETILAGEVGDEGNVTPPPAIARAAALEILAWGHLAQGNDDEAGKVHAAICKIGDPDVALTAAIFMAKGNDVEARKLLERAFGGQSDRRKEVVGPLIRLWLEAGEVRAAAEAAYEIHDSLSVEDARHMVTIAMEHHVYEAASLLSEAMFKRTADPEDAYAAARAHALAGAVERAFRSLKAAVEAGFSDSGRAWSDSALDVLRSDPDHFAAVVPRP